MSNLYSFLSLIAIPTIAYVCALCASYAQANNRKTLFIVIHVLPCITLIFALYKPILLGGLAIY